MYFTLYQVSFSFSSFVLNCVLKLIFDVLDKLEVSKYRSLANEKINAGQFFNLTFPVVVVGNLFGLMPLTNFHSKNPNQLYYSRVGVTYLYSMVIQFCLLVLFGTSFVKQLAGGVEFKKLSK